MPTRQKGFSLIELLIVVAIILIIAAVAILNLLRSRMAANEASAVGSIRTINTSAVTYSSTYPNDGFPASLAALGGPSPCTATSTAACLTPFLLAARRTGMCLHGQAMATRPLSVMRLLGRRSRSARLDSACSALTSLA
jgi:prepilin-type N-terminal cleavage/methylation domain-containing protein